MAGIRILLEIAVVADAINLAEFSSALHWDRFSLGLGGVSPSVYMPVKQLTSSVLAY
jgi:hypothetical protein